MSGEPKPRWSMVLSHHPPIQYERTLHIYGVRICARCTGVVAGLAIGAGTARIFTPGWAPAGYLLIALMLATLAMGVIVFVLNECGMRASNNVERIVFGVVVGFLFFLSLQGGTWVAVAAVTCVVAAQFVSAYWLRRQGQLERFVSEYLEGAIASDPLMPEVSCGRFFCACTADRFKLPRESGSGTQ